MLSPRADASRSQRSTASRLMSVAVTLKPAWARPIACVPMPHAASSTVPPVSPRSPRRRVMIAACHAIACSQSPKMRWYSAASSS